MQFYCPCSNTVAHNPGRSHPYPSGRFALLSQTPGSEVLVTEATYEL